jgi:GGDEF domain-containing protein
MNRTEPFDRFLTDFSKAWLRTGSPDCCIVVFDIDLLAYATYHLGYQAVDQHLVRVEETLRIHTTTDQTLARIGGDEFALGEPRACTEALCMQVTNILRAVAQIPVEPHVYSRASKRLTRNCLSMSAVIASYPRVLPSLQDLRSLWESALYQPSLAPPSTLVLFGPSDSRSRATTPSDPLGIGA